MLQLTQLDCKAQSSSSACKTCSNLRPAKFFKRSKIIAQAAWMENKAKVEAQVPVGVAYQMWQDTVNISKWMPWISKIEPVEGEQGRFWWVLSTRQLDRDWTFSWQSRNLTPIKNQKLHWVSVDGMQSIKGIPEVKNKGQVRFLKRGNEACVVELNIQYELPDILIPVGNLVRPIVEGILQADMNRFAEMSKQGQLQQSTQASASTNSGNGDSNTGSSSNGDSNTGSSGTGDSNTGSSGTVSEVDKKYMKQALELAYKAEGQTDPNPIVGCVIVKEGQVIGTGYHKECGGPHAEVFALKDAKDRGESVVGSTAYVTLEPCAHFGKTPPCANALVREQVGRVVVGVMDSNPLVGGKGVGILRDAGVEVVVGCLEEECREANKDFFKRISQEAEK